MGEIEVRLDMPAQIAQIFVGPGRAHLSVETRFRYGPHTSRARSRPHWCWQSISSARHASAPTSEWAGAVTYCSSGTVSPAIGDPPAHKRFLSGSPNPGPYQGYHLRAVCVKAKGSRDRSIIDRFLDLIGSACHRACAPRPGSGSHGNETDLASPKRQRLCRT